MTPRAVVCYEPDGVTNCRYNVVCHDARRLVQALTAPPFGPFRGPACWAYQMLTARVSTVAVPDPVENATRAALQEGA